MIDEQELKDSLAALLDERGIRADTESLGDLDGAGNGGTRAPSDDGAAVLSELRLAVGAHLGSAHLDEAHTAVAGRAERRMVAVVRDVAAGLHTGLDEAGSLGELLPLAVDLDIDHGNGRSSGLSLGFGGGGGGAHRIIGKEWRKRRSLSPLVASGARKKDPRDSEKPILLVDGGGGGIRTHGGFNTSSVFKTDAIDHSATPPDLVFMHLG